MQAFGNYWSRPFYRLGTLPAGWKLWRVLCTDNNNNNNNNNRICIAQVCRMTSEALKHKDKDIQQLDLVMLLESDFLQSNYCLQEILHWNYTTKLNAQRWALSLPTGTLSPWACFLTQKPNHIHLHANIWKPKRVNHWWRRQVIITQLGSLGEFTAPP